MKIFHAADIHYCLKHLEWVDKAFNMAIDNAIEQKAEVAVIAGDLFDKATQLHDPSSDACFKAIKRLANHMPVLVLQGTFSHDKPGSLSPIRSLHSNIFVSDKIQQVQLLGNGEWQVFKMGDKPEGIALFSTLPSINKGEIAAAIGGENASTEVSGLVEDLCIGWSVHNKMARKAEIPTIMVAHGTVNGCITECDHAMVSQDHEFSTGSMYAASANATMLGHIHAHQHWENELSPGQRIAYPGSITKLIHGHKGETGFIMWDVTPDSSSFDFHPTPSKNQIDILYEGAPDMDDLEKRSRDIPDGSYIRVRWVIDEEYRASIDKQAMRDLFPTANEVKLEGRVNLIQRRRAEGISEATTIEAKLVKWCELTDTDSEPLLERLAMLQASDPEVIINKVTAP